ncbi:wyosine [tRNA(Phe)-imidazoG37] synthetase (radical SAM superfamily) [Nitrosomonas sp. Nm84]|uniref:radical SAM protein n=1 Tax=Nitrosomonas sp. Nm84 TaxID=200124 RepID=UPI000D766727|nr:radical SAM protein [Nitrosomonas sp. Nm84]PXW87220.1 wyosine [tRNA(Phe)-imidazoG37] synthetase (radical SAM superfamily) [Nitrosomonas sp. Nm84]
MPSNSDRLKTTDHSRDSAGLTYVYPVVSRRAGGVSIGINLNPNNACNWRCVYCQVPELKRGSAPRIDLDKLETELRSFLHELVNGDFMHRHVPPEARKIHDIALSGNGEPTSAKEFEQVIELIGSIIQDFDVLKNLKLVLITNGSLIHRQSVQAGLQHMAQLNGEVWFKFDRALAEERQRINNTTISLKKIRHHLQIATSLCPTWLQTCVFQINGKPPSESEIDAYLGFIKSLKNDGVLLQGVLLYGIARPSLQPEAPQLSQVSESWLIAYGEKIKALGLPVKTHF